MKKTFWDAEARDAALARIDRLTDATKPAWGKMTADRMLAHLAESMKMATGELRCESKKLPIRYFPLKQLIIYVAPFPKSAPTAPELLARQPREWAHDVSDVQDLLARAGSARTTEAWPEHPAFGRLSKRAWGVLIYRHMDHHLKQFGA